MQRSHIVNVGLGGAAWALVGVVATRPATAQEAEPVPAPPPAAAVPAPVAEEPAAPVPPAVQEPVAAAAAEPAAPPPAPAAPPPADSAPPPEPPPLPAAEEAPSDFESSVHWGVGIRTELVMDPSVDAPDADSPDPDDPQFSMGYNIRPYVGGAVHENVKFEGNLDTDGTNVRLLDAVIKLEFSDLFNVWFGHFLPPTDRANLSGPYFQNAWNYPVGQHLYPSDYAGRNDGIAYWGQAGGGKFKWQIGLFDVIGVTTPRIAGRLTLNLLDPEPGYYNSSTYYGSKDILAIGAVLHHISEPGGDPDADAQTLFSLDALYENDIGPGTITLEPAFYAFGGADQGNSFSILASFLFAGKVGIGQVQPMFRLQQASWGEDENFMNLGPDGSSTTIDAALNYIIDGHWARLTANLQHASVTIGAADAVTNTIFTLGAQVQRF